MTIFNRFVLVAALAAAPVAAKDKDDVAKPQVYLEVVQCKQIADSAPRLACFDAASAKLEQAAAAKDIVILDRAEVRETKRSLFGFALPKLPFFEDEKEGEFSTIETSLTSAAPIDYGKYLFQIPDGGTWETTEPAKDFLRAGQKVIIKRAALGSFRMQVGRGGFVRVKRVR
jgi:hypothetical protein